MAFAGRTILITMKLQKIQRHGIQGFSNLTTTGIDEKTNRGHEGRQRPHNRPRPTHRNRPRTLRVEHQADGVGAGLGRHQGILDAGNPADLAANH